MTTSTPNSGTLYLVATPLGNLEDFTFRAVRILREVSVIAAEDTRHTRKLLAHYEIHRPLRSLHDHSLPRDIAALVALLEAGESVAYVSDAGSPGVSDPGAELVAAARAAGIEQIVPLPGPSAVATAFSVAGLTAPGFIFAGFPPRTAQDRREFLQRWTAQPLPVILFESPHRVRATLEELAELLPEREVVIARELTKQFEQVLSLPAAEAATALAEDQWRGEFTLVVAGAPRGAAAAGPSEDALNQAIRYLTAAGLPRKTIGLVLQLLTPLSRNEAYRKAGEA
ncbi:MAG TPA: 16S rRNA (cytidine(1402)-2'-O)-methyltransferase [Armatimonadota bacterium]|jgi:16S rRNA (cytidine1402-2'-O)-methyltransferase